MFFTEHQFKFGVEGFVTKLISFYSRTTDVLQERNRRMDCIYLDLKASDKVPHTWLL